MAPQNNMLKLHVNVFEDDKLSLNIREYGEPGL